MGSRRYLPDDHMFRREITSFNNQQEWQLAPERPGGEECFDGAQKEMTSLETVQFKIQMMIL